MTPRPYLTLVKRRSLHDYLRDLLVQRFAEIEALRADLKRLQRLTSAVARCEQCRVLSTITIQADGAWRCRRCTAAQEALA